MLSNSNDRLFGGLNQTIAEAYKSMKETSVSDPQKSKDQLNEKDKEHVSAKDVEKVEKEIEKAVDSLKEGCSDKKMEEESCNEKKIEESQDYETCMDKDTFIRRTKELGLKLEQEGDHTIAKTVNDDMKAWWNDHTGVGYIRKDYINPLHEDKNSEEKDQKQIFLESLSEEEKSNYEALSEDAKISFHKNEFEKLEESESTDMKDFHFEMWRTLLKEEIKKGNA